MRQIYPFLRCMFFFRYKADIVPVTLFVLYFLLDILVYFFIQDVLIFFAYMAVSIVIKGFICAWNHHHQHVQTFSLPILNRFLEVIYGFQTGIVGYAWVLHHNLGHHVHYQDQSKDDSAWKSPRGETYGPLLYTWIVSITAYPRAWKVGKRYPTIQRYFLAMCLIQLLLLTLLIVYRPLAGIFVFLIPMITGLLLTVYTTYSHHSGLDSDDHYTSSYNIRDTWYNFFTGNLGYHTAHHMKGSLHWSKLPEPHREISHKIDLKYYQEYSLFGHSRFVGAREEQA